MQQIGRSEGAGRATTAPVPTATGPVTADGSPNAGGDCSFAAPSNTSARGRWLPVTVSGPRGTRSLPGSPFTPRSSTPARAGGTVQNTTHQPACTSEHRAIAEAPSAETPTPHSPQTINMPPRSTRRRGTRAGSLSQPEDLPTPPPETSASSEPPQKPPPDTPPSPSPPATATPPPSPSPETQPQDPVQHLSLIHI